MEAVREALRLCTETIVPSLFPFLVLSSLLTALFPVGRLDRALSPLMQPLFHLGGSAAAVLVLGFTGGYPVGVRTTAALYEQGRLPKEEAERLLSFCNNSGPGFLLGVVGMGVFGSTAVGLTLYGIHILAALLVGFLFRFYKGSGAGTKKAAPPRARKAAQTLPEIFTEAVTGSFSAVLNICAFVLFFMIALRLLSFTGLLHLLSAALAALLSPAGVTEQLATALVAGFLELSTGSACLQGVELTPLTAALSAFLLGWGGLSVHCQSLSFLLHTDLSCRPYFVGKFLQGAFSAALAWGIFSALL
jgi:sporulation integral membrane protein YlbJ